MKLEALFLAFGLVSLVRGQVGPGGYTTVANVTCTTTGTQIYAVTDSAGVLYDYTCGGGSGGTALTTISTTSVNHWQDCFTYCDNFVGTVSYTGFSYVSSQRYQHPNPSKNFTSKFTIACLFD